MRLKKGTQANSLADGAFHCKNKLTETTVPARESLTRLYQQNVTFELEECKTLRHRVQHH